MEEGLDVLHVPKFLADEEELELLHYLKSDAMQWHRVKYASKRFRNQCTTPCWTNMMGGVEGAPYYQPFNDVIGALKAKLESHLHTTFNVCLLRLYMGGHDEIAWHTDAREFLGDTTVVASISLGAERKFEMKKVEGDLWPELEAGPSKKKARVDSAPVHSWQLKQGDLFVMQGATQKSFYHRVPPQASVKAARFNLNFRRIVFDASKPEVALRGHNTYYKYCVYGDDQKGYPEFARTFSQIETKANNGTPSITSFFKRAPVAK